MTVTIAVETPLQDDVRELVALLNAHLLPLSPVEFQFKMTAEQMAGADTTVFVARDAAGRALGCGALKMAGDRQAEVKRLFTRPEVRGKRVGSALLAAITELARSRGVHVLLLETGRARDSRAPGASTSGAVFCAAVRSSTIPTANGRASMKSRWRSRPAPDVAIIPSPR